MTCIWHFEDRADSGWVPALADTDTTLEDSSACVTRTVGVRDTRWVHPAYGADPRELVSFFTLRANKPPECMVIEEEER